MDIEKGGSSKNIEKKENGDRKEIEKILKKKVRDFTDEDINKLETIGCVIEIRKDSGKIMLMGIRKAVELLKNIEIIKNKRISDLTDEDAGMLEELQYGITRDDGGKIIGVFAKMQKAQEFRE